MDRDLGPARGGQLSQDAGDVVLDRPGAQEQARSDLVVGQADGHQARNLLFARLWGLTQLTRVVVAPADVVTLQNELKAHMPKPPQVMSKQGPTSLPRAI